MIKNTVRDENDNPLNKQKYCINEVGITIEFYNWVLQVVAYAIYYCVLNVVNL